ncbi:hypothetical protein GCK32_021210, partial [Trichostrongylus colubriformis]
LESTTQFTLRMTSKLPKRSCGFMFAGYKTILCTGFVRGVAVNGVVRGDILLASGQMIDRPGLLEVIPPRIYFYGISTAIHKRVYASGTTQFTAISPSHYTRSLHSIL